MEGMSFFTHEVHIPLRLQFYTTNLPWLKLRHPPQCPHNLVAAGIGHRPRSPRGNLLPLPTSPTKRKKWWLRVGLTLAGVRIPAPWDQIAGWQQWWRLPREGLSPNWATSLFCMITSLGDVWMQRAGFWRWPNANSIDFVHAAYCRLAIQLLLRSM
jgi:hypothetical protein